MSRRASRKNPNAKQKKLGRLYEDAVCSLFRQFYPAASINAGVWVTGPDGRRELDVEITESHGDRVIHGVIECKDFNRTTTGPVGIAYIDALDSKRRDLHLDFALICSNAGFTSDAIRKAKRVGIGLVGATRKGDYRIRFSVVEEIYIRHIGIKEFRLRFWLCTGEEHFDPNLQSNVFTFEGRPIYRWFNMRLSSIIVNNPIVQGAFNDHLRFVSPIIIEWPGGGAKVERIGMEFELEGAWFVQTITIDSSAGIYDWLRKRMRLAPAETQQLQLINVDYFAGEWTLAPPAPESTGDKLLPNEVDIQFVVFKNKLEMDDPPHLDPYVIPEDLSIRIEDILQSNMNSIPGFS